MAEHRYRPEIDGLRAIAVIAVIVFHLDREWLPGGFVGVDVFFVISGYLVTSILVRDHAAGAFSFLKFYQRRIARIFPAVLAMALVTLLAARMLYSTWDYANAGASLSASLLSIANFHLLMQGDYFQLSADAQPFLHCWSLAVEEQFYILFPFVLWLVLKAGPRLRIGILVALALASLASCVWLTPSQPSLAFYLLPTRAWELLAGSVLAFGVSQRASWLSWIGLGLTITSFVALQEDHRFPGSVALLPVVGSMLVIRYSSTGASRDLLAWSPLVAIGKLSYSLYLWHWPIFSLVDYSLAFESTGLRLALKLALTAIASVICYRFVESPARTSLNVRTRRPHAYASLAIALVVLGPLGYAIRSDHYIDASDGANGELAFPRPAAEGTIVLMGDSQATMYGEMVRDLAKDRNLHLVVLSIAGEDPLAHSNGRPNTIWETNLEAIRREKPEHLVIACHWGYKLKSDPARLAASLKQLEPHVGRIVLLAMPPHLPAAAERSAIRDGSRPPFLEEAEDRKLRMEVNAVVREQASASIDIIEVAPLFVNDAGAVTAYDEKRRPLFHDEVHLSGEGVARVRPLLESALYSRITR